MCAGKCLSSMLASQQQAPVIRGWQNRPGASGGGLGGGVPSLGRGGIRGGSMDRGGRPSRGRGYQYGGGGRGAYDGSWGGPGTAGGPGSVQADPTSDQWSPRKEYSGGRGGMENWRRSRPLSDDHLGGEPGGSHDGAGWRRMPAPTSSMFEKWGRSTSWRDSSGAGAGGDDDRLPTERQRGSWSSGGGEGQGGGRPTLRRPGGGGGSWDHEDHLPEWATENPADGGGSFDDKGAFHGSDDEQCNVHSDGGMELILQVIRAWYRQFKKTGSITKGKSTGRSRVPDEMVDAVRHSFTRSPRQSTSRAGSELGIPQPTVWKILRKRLRFKPYRLQMLQSLRPDDHVNRVWAELDYRLDYRFH
ncbi:unnamed protein product [Acanthoscelides obtectus]|uniref:Uncharacterized protein n=1 Tax=Acanthoscelides obtectus TaxID=200917 RepID=A0A9P0Q9V9_ACAOB|nr:unnamed protein product [Acanthoscelides obtectus]CAK1623285.1 GIGYF family protein CG11148 [Acanthoscelides obtectus]